MELFYWFVGIVVVLILVKVGINKYLNSKYQRALDKEYNDYLDSLNYPDGDIITCMEFDTKCANPKRVIKSKKAKTSKPKAKKSSK